jgi:hypothetical protein
MVYRHEIRDRFTGRNPPCLDPIQKLQERHFERDTYFPVVVWDVGHALRAQLAAHIRLIDDDVFVFFDSHPQLTEHLNLSLICAGQKGYSIALVALCRPVLKDIIAGNNRLCQRHCGKVFAQTGQKIAAQAGLPAS